MIRLFRRSRAKPAPQWPEAELARRLTDPDYTCICCGTPWHASAGIIHPEAPFGWKNPPPAEPDTAFEGAKGEILTENYARRFGDTLLRAVLPIPVQGTDAAVFIGVWCNLKIGHHAWFRAAQERREADRLGEMASRLYTQLPQETGPLLTDGVLLPQPDGLPPFYRITAQKHPYFDAQTQGMTATDILKLYEDFGQGDVVAHLKA